MKALVLVLLCASPSLQARTAASIVLGDSPEDCDCTAAPTPTRQPSATPTATPTPSPSLTPTPLAAIDEILALGFDAAWESQGLLLITLSGEATNFDTNKDTLKVDAKLRLQELARILARFPDNLLKVDGHTDNRGGRNYNIDLSRRRAQRVKKTLVDFGMEEPRFESVEGWAFDRPIADNSHDAGRAKNRRVELRLKFTGYLVDGGRATALTPTMTPTPRPGDQALPDVAPLWREAVGSPTPLPDDARLRFSPTPDQNGPHSVGLEIE